MKMARPRFASVVPKCATEEQVVAWIEQASRVKANPMCGFCTDCCPVFKARMVIQDRCENPGVRFFETQTDGVYGAFA